MFSSGYKSQPSWMDAKDESGYNSSAGSSPIPGNQTSFDLNFIRFNPPPPIRILSRTNPENYQILSQHGNQMLQQGLRRTGSGDQVSNFQNPQSGAWNPSKQSLSISENQESRTWYNQDLENMKNHQEPSTWFNQDEEKKHQEPSAWCNQENVNHQNFGYFSNYENLKRSLNQYSCSTEFYTPEIQHLLTLAQACDIVRKSWV